MINREECIDETVAALVEEHGWLGGLLHARLLAFIDVDGNVPGSGHWLASSLFPHEMEKGKVTAGECAKIADSMCSLGLCIKYQAEGLPYLHFPNFHKHQGGLRRDKERPHFPSYVTQAAKTHQIEEVVGPLVARQKARKHNLPTEKGQDVAAWIAEVVEQINPDRKAIGRLTEWASIVVLLDGNCAALHGILGKCREGHPYNPTGLLIAAVNDYLERRKAQVQEEGHS